MPATVQINERNGAPAGTLTLNISNSNYGSVDAPNLVVASNPIVAGENSFEKWQQLEVTAMGGSTAVQNLKYWYTGTLSGSDAMMTNARTSSYGGAETYATPSESTSSVATQVAPTSEPSSSNWGIAGSLSGSLTGVGSSDYLVTQLQVDLATTAGASLTNHYQYDEIA